MSPDVFIYGIVALCCAFIIGCSIESGFEKLGKFIYKAIKGE